jgi:hypothetical protein
MRRLIIALTFALLSTSANAQQPSSQTPTARPVPDNVVTFVREQALPANPVMVSVEVKVGQTLPGEIVLTPVPNTQNYAFAVVNQQRVIVEPASRVVLDVIR